MRILKRDSYPEIIIQQLEDWLTEHDVSINGIEYITVLGKDFLIKDIDDDRRSISLPRALDSERITLIED